MDVRGVFIEDASHAFHGEPHLNGFRVSYAYLSEEKLRLALEIAAEEIRKALGV